MNACNEYDAIKCMKELCCEKSEGSVSGHRTKKL